MTRSRVLLAAVSAATLTVPVAAVLGMARPATHAGAAPPAPPPSPRAAPPPSSPAPPTSMPGATRPSVALSVPGEPAREKPAVEAPAPVRFDPPAPPAPDPEPATPPAAVPPPVYPSPAVAESTPAPAERTAEPPAIAVSTPTAAPALRPEPLVEALEAPEPPAPLLLSPSPPTPLPPSPAPPVPAEQPWETMAPETVPVPAAEAPLEPADLPASPITVFRAEARTESGLTLFRAPEARRAGAGEEPPATDPAVVEAAGPSTVDAEGGALSLFRSAPTTVSGASGLTSPPNAQPARTAPPAPVESPLSVPVERPAPAPQPTPPTAAVEVSEPRPLPMPGARVPARLATAVVASAGATVPLVAETKGVRWCSAPEGECPDVVWIGEGRLDGAGRIAATFSQAVLEGEPRPVSAVALGEGSAPGLAASLSDQAPRAAQDLLRAALGGVSDYARALADRARVTVVNGVVGVEPVAPPNVLDLVIGRAAGIFALPPQQAAFVRVATVPAGAPLEVLVLSSPGSGRAP